MLRNLMRSYFYKRCFALKCENAWINVAQSDLDVGTILAQVNTLCHLPEAAISTVLH